MPEDTTHVEHERNPTALIVVTVLVLFACALALLVGVFVQNTTERQIADIRARNPAFNLEDTTPRADATALYATQETRLNGYDWTDREAGVARIPIERAMALMIAGQTASPEPTASPPG